MASAVRGSVLPGTSPASTTASTGCSRTPSLRCGISARRSSTPPTSRTPTSSRIFEFKTDLEAYLGSLGPSQPCRTLAELIAFNGEHADVEMPFFGQERFEKAAEKGPLTEPAYVEALATCRRLSRGEGIDAVMDEHRLDALVAPSNAPAWRIDYANGDHYVGGNSTPAAVAGYPNVTVPMGFAFDLPIGLSFMGRAWSERTLIRLASAFERATRHRRPPHVA
jgi:amidase